MQAEPHHWPGPTIIGPTKLGGVITPAQPVIVTPANAIRVNPIVVISPIRPTIVAAGAAIIVEPRQVESTRVHPSQAERIQPPPRGAWDERGWTSRTSDGHSVYEGNFQVFERRSGRERVFSGRIVANGRVTAYILNPPPEIKQHRHGPCFQLTNNGWFKLHWRRPAQNPDEAILYMERILDESLNQ
jgi:hypothetical protein